MTAFDEHYRSIYGERWEELRRHLEATPRKVALLNPFASRARSQLPDDATEHPSLDGCFVRPQGSEFPRPDGDDEALSPYYLLDAASVLAGRACEVSAGDRVLDMCAAPGGKTLVVMFELGASGMMVANDRSSNRRKRLRDVLRSHLPEEVRRHVAVRPHDARKWGTRQRDAFDTILVDAPCSGERHLVGDERRLSEWSTARSRHLADRQFALLCAAVDVVRPRGRIVYSTCALEPTENDDVVARLLQERGGRVECERRTYPFGEPTEFGWRVLPDRGGWGPMYIATLRNTESE